ncbi:MAG: TNT domain-containing protein [Clostridiales Family XIII bacterium]|nr:TNT domain-containing protein [Clostridiales Family XIII bacterium]
MLIGGATAYAEGGSGSDIIASALNTGTDYATAQLITGGFLEFTTVPRIVYPPYDGFYIRPTDVLIEEGTTISRIGEAKGGFFAAPEGTPFEARSLPEYKRYGTVHIYEVVKPIPAKKGITAPWFGQVGYGTQFKFENDIFYLRDNGYLKEIISSGTIGE